MDEKCNLQCPILKIHIRVLMNASFFLIFRMKYPQPPGYPSLHCESMVILCVFNDSLLPSRKNCDRSPDNNLSAKTKCQKGATQGVVGCHLLCYRRSASLCGFCLLKLRGIAQIAPLSFQGSHRTQTQTSEVRWLHSSVVTEWSPACLHKQFPGDLHRGNSRKPQMEDVHNLINIGPTNPIQILNQHEIFWRFCMCNSNDTFDKNKKCWSRYWGSTAKTGSLLGIKQT